LLAVFWPLRPSSTQYTLTLLRQGPWTSWLCAEPVADRLQDLAELEEYLEKGSLSSVPGVFDFPRGLVKI